MEQLKDALGSKGQFFRSWRNTLKTTVAGKNYPWRYVHENTEICKKGNLDNRYEAKNLKTVKVDLKNGKDEIRWRDMSRTSKTT